MMLWNFLVAFNLVYADIIRDDGNQSFEGLFNVVHKGRMQQVLTFYNNVQLDICAKHCEQHLRCRTFNYHQGKKDCELTDEDFNEMNVDNITAGWYNYGIPPKIDGGWSGWRNFTQCTKKCGNGTLEQRRDCDSPKAEYGGAGCEGKIRRTVKCNTHECPDSVEMLIIPLLVLQVTNILLNGIGIYLLICIGKKNKTSIQNIIILNISANHVTMNFLGLISPTFSIIETYNIKVPLSKEIGEHLTIFRFTGVGLAFHLLMFYITIDRLLNVLYSLRYHIYCTQKKAKILMVITWVICCLVGATFMLVYHFIGINVIPIFYDYVYPILDFVYIFVVLITYVVIFKKIAASEEFRQNNSQSLKSKYTTILRKPKFFVPFLIISTFIIFMVVPDLTIMFVGLSTDAVASDDLLYACNISFTVSNICDACIYIFMKKPVRDLFMKKVGIKSRQRYTSEVSQNQLGTSRL